ncbi:MAG: family transcriptional regulator [Amycolatopsis sp.]|uniref:AfsR/SARP family transcriptional regulator n=1 Tax=Amycolatopsis sp. TaxID=37632 RepID=UPI00262FC855|nr:BTAD domain-containing putative transcriptional regulator [Amycolatopsis sp.]MCU1679761.1 family transcriptional regulator [Amycolatopsis sp.]
MKFQVLGPLTASIALPSAGQPRRVLSILLAKAGEFVPRDTLVDEMWPEGAPPSASAIVQMAVSKLRKALGVEPGGDRRLLTGPLGYRLSVGAGELDADEFLKLAAEAASATDPARRRALLEAAQDSWRGPALADVVGGPLVEAHKLWLNDRRWAVFADLVDLDLAEGRHPEVVERLAPVIAERPTDERLVAGFVTALDRCGRRDAALESLRRTREALWEHTGVRPGPELLALYRRLAGRDWTAVGPPAQLPPATPDFAGRVGALAELDRALRTPGPVVLHGPGGAGKTTLAIKAARRALKRYPDGQLFAELRRPDGTGVEPRAVLAAFLRALGVPREELPSDASELIALWRGHTAHRRLLVLLDDVASERQLRSLLPSGSACAALVTTRRRLPGLAGARAVDVGDFTDAEAFDLLGSVAGRARLDAEPGAAARLVQQCRGLPMAVRVVGAKLAHRPYLQVGELVARLAVERRTLDELVAGDLSIRGAIKESLRDCPPQVREAVRLLGALKLREVTEWSAAALLDLGIPQARDVLDGLADCHLVRVTSRDQLGFVRYALHDFVRLFAREAEDASAVRRVLDGYLAAARHVATSLGRAVTTSEDAVALPSELRSRIEADPIAWRESEIDNLATTVRIASGHRWHRLTERLSGAFTALADVRPADSSARVVSLLGLAAARRGADQTGTATKLLDLGTLHWERGRAGSARRYFAMAEARFRALDDQRGRGAALIALADVDAEVGDGIGALNGLRESLTLLRGCGDVGGQSVASYQLGSLLDDLGDGRGAIESFEVGMLLAETCGDARQYSRAGKRYADVLRRHGRYDEAASLLDEALRGAVNAHERHWEAHVLRSIGDLHTELSEPDESRRHLTRSLELFEQLGHQHAAAYTHRGLAEAWHRAGDPALAERHLATAMGTFRELKDRRGAGYALLSLGRIRGRSGDAPGAAASLTQAVDVFRGLGFPLWELRALSELAEVPGSHPSGRDQVRDLLTKISANTRDE